MNVLQEGDVCPHVKFQDAIICNMPLSSEFEAAPILQHNTDIDTNSGGK